MRERIELSRHKKHDIDVLIDDIDLVDFVDQSKQNDLKTKITEATYDNALGRLREGIERALVQTDGLVRLVFGQSKKKQKF